MYNTDLSPIPEVVPYPDSIPGEALQYPEPTGKSMGVTSALIAVQVMG